MICKCNDCSRSSCCDLYLCCCNDSRSMYDLYLLTHSTSSSFSSHRVMIYPTLTHSLTHSISFISSSSFSSSFRPSLTLYLILAVRSSRYDLLFLPPTHSLSFSSSLILTVSLPSPDEEGQILIRVECAALNRMDILQAQGKYPLKKEW